MITLRRAYVWSIFAHAVFALAFGRLHVKAEASRADAVLRERAAEHAPVYRRRAAEMQADQIRRMRELIEKLAAKEREDAAGSAATADKAAAPDPTPLSPSRPPDATDAWRHARPEYLAARERFLEQRAARLAELRGIDAVAARKLAEESQGAGAEGAGAPRTEAEAAERIGQMHAEVRQMLTESRRMNGGEANGQPLDPAAGAEAFWLTQTQQSGRETSGFDESVDWTGLMRTSHGGGPVNARLDSPDDLRRIDRYGSARLRRRLQTTATQIAFTRRIGGEASTTAAWACPDAWYVIGPFPNPNRSAIDRTYPPELEIDRDAVYEGNEGRPVTWIYTKPQRHVVIPPHVVEYGIYYGFTEIFCADEMDCWLALGSDDHSKLWINDLLVWSSSKNLKTRDTGEGFRKVHLAKGINRFLFRLENGWNGAEFSLLIGLE